MTKLSMRQISKLANVAPSTVSRALQDHPSISPETKRKIHNIIDQQKQKPIGIVIANPTGNLTDDTFFSEVIHGASEYLKKEARQLLVETFDGNKRDELPSLVTGKQVAGLIVGGIPIADSIIEGILATNLPLVFIGKYLQDSHQLSAVISDNIMGGRLAGQHLAQCGYDEFFFLGGSLKTNTFADRLRGFKEGLEICGKSLPKENILISEMNQQGGYQSTLHILKDHSSKSRGIFASTDWMASGVIRALQQNQIPIPENYGVVGYSDLDLASHIYPTLTSIRVEKGSLGYLAARNLLDQIYQSVLGPLQSYLQPQLVVRESTRRVEKEINECLE